MGKIFRCSPGEGERQEDDAAIPAIDAIPRLGVPAPGGIDGGGIIEVDEAKCAIPPPMLIRELLGLSKLGWAGIWKSKICKVRFEFCEE